MSFTGVQVGSPTRIQLTDENQFGGGLNLKADAFQLRGSESPDLLNVDIDPSGGFGLRRGAATQNLTPLPAPPDNVFTFSKGTSFWTLVQVGNQLYQSTGAEFTSLALSGAIDNGVMRAAVFNDNLYVQRNAAQDVVKWTGTGAATELGVAYNDDIAAPDDGNMPRAKCIAVHGGRVWAGNVMEGATAHPSRVRFSHPNKAENWRGLDYIDIDVGHEGDEITGLVPFQDRLLVFKRNSVHAIYGFDPDTFGVQPIAQTVGAISQEAIATTERECYFFSWPEGVHRFDGRKVEWLFDRLEPLITDNRIAGANANKITCGFLNHRLWVGVPMDGGSANNRALVFDPTLSQSRRSGPRGGWTLYDLPVGPMVQREIPGQAQAFLACSAASPYLLRVDLHDTFTDKITTAEIETVWTPVETLIRSHYVTRWFDENVSRQIKRWRRPEFVLDADKPAVLRVQTFHNYDPSRVRREFFVTVDQANADETGVWAVDVEDDEPPALLWDLGRWAFNAPGIQAIERGSNLGRARSVQLKVFGPVIPAPWAVNEISMTYKPRRVK